MSVWSSRFGRGADELVPPLLVGRLYLEQRGFDVLKTLTRLEVELFDEGFEDLIVHASIHFVGQPSPGRFRAAEAHWSPWTAIIVQRRVSTASPEESRPRPPPSRGATRPHRFRHRADCGKHSTVSRPGVLIVRPRFRAIGWD